MSSRRRFSGEAGVTMIELLVVMALTGVVGAIAVAFVVITVEQNRVSENDRAAGEAIRTTGDRVAADLRGATAVRPSSNSQQVAVWIDSNGDNASTPNEVVTWRLVPDSGGFALTRRALNEPGGRTMATGLTSESSFIYDASPPATREVSVTLASAAGAGSDRRKQSITFSVQLRNSR